MKESTEWESTTNKFKKLQEEWKKVGNVPRSEAGIIYKSFKNSCDSFFKRKRAFEYKVIKEDKANEGQYFIQKRIRNLERNVALWKNNRHFFSPSSPRNSKASEEIISSFEERIKDAEKEISLLKTKKNEK